jgi:ABC-type transport system substrate-binding protein
LTSDTPDGKSPFVDERVRQAVSLSWDRKAWVDAFYNVPALESGGLPVDARWNSALPADFGDSVGWLDPQGKDFGPNAKNYQYNVEEGKKLMAAAGHAAGLDVKSNRITTNEVANLARHAEALEGMVANVGIRIKINQVNYATEYIPNVRDANGQFEGIGWHTVRSTLAP